MVNGECLLRTHSLRTLYSLIYALYSIISTLLIQDETRSV